MIGLPSNDNCTELFGIHEAESFETVRKTRATPLWTRPRVRAFQSRCPLRRKRESQHREKRSVAIHRASTDTSVALIMAKTASPFLRFIRFTEPVVMIEVTGPAAVLMTISETTLSDTICPIVPGKRLRMLVLMTLRGYLTSATAPAGASSCPVLHHSLNSPACSCVSITLPAES